MLSLISEVTLEQQPRDGVQRPGQDVDSAPTPRDVTFVSCAERENGRMRTIHPLFLYGRELRI